MPRFLLATVLFLLTGLTGHGQETFSRLPDPALVNPHTPPVLTLPNVSTPDGVRLPAGEYRVYVQHTMLVPVGRPSALLGYFPGPTVTLVRLPNQEGSDYEKRLDLFAPADRLVLKTQSEAWVVYDVPHMRSDPRTVGMLPVQFAPLIRGGVLKAVVYQGYPLYITKAKWQPRR